MKVESTEYNRLISHLHKRHWKQNDTEFKEKIIELSRSGKTIKEIRAEVGGNNGDIGDIRMKARRAGLW